jgi:hypothetical protein
LLECSHTYDRITTASLGFADGDLIPLYVTEHVVYGFLRISLPSTTPHHRHIWMLFEKPAGLGWPATNYLTVPINEKRVSKLAVHFNEPMKPFVSSARGCEWNTCIQIDNRYATATGGSYGIVRRTRVDVYDKSNAAEHGIEAAAQPLPLIPANDHCAY